MKNAVMLNAWTLYKEATAANPEYKNRATFAAALREAWAQAKRAERTASEEWQSKGGESQFTALVKMVYTVRRHAERDGYAFAEWVQTADDARTAAAEAWAILAERLDKDNGETDGNGLSRLMYNAARAAVMRIHRAELKHASALKSRTTEDGKTLEVLDLAASVMGEQSDSPEAAAIRLDLIERALETTEERTIAVYLAAGHTVRDIAAIMGMSKSAVDRRIQGFRARFAAL